MMNKLVGSEYGQEQLILPNTYSTNMANAANCSNLSSCAAPVHIETNLHSDSCLENERNKQSVQMGDYMVSNFRNCDCNVEQVLNNATQNRGLLVQDGYGVSGCNVDSDTQLRVGEVESRPKPCQQLFTRPYATVPYMGRGSGNSDVESFLKSGKQTYQQGHVSKEANQVRTFNNTLTPLVPNLEQQIQNPMNLVEEVNDAAWVRGGTPTRQIVKDLDYYERSKDNEEIKDYVLGKKQYMKYCVE